MNGEAPLTEGPWAIGLDTSHPHRHSREIQPDTAATRTSGLVNEGQKAARSPARPVPSPARRPTMHPMRRGWMRLRSHLVRAPRFNFARAKTAQEFVDQAEKYVLRVRASYDFRAMWHRRFHRLSGVLLIVLGGTLPLLASSGLAHRDAVIAAVGFVVATVTALRGFYRWDAGWVLLRETEFEVTKRYLDWKAQQVEMSDAHRLQRETHRLLNDLIAIRKNEAQSFFKAVPDVGRSVSEQNTAPGATHSGR